MNNYIIPRSDEGREFWRELNKLIKLPEGCIGCDIRVRSDEIVTVNAVIYSMQGTGEPTIKRYSLVEEEEPK